MYRQVIKENHLLDSNSTETLYYQLYKVIKNQIQTKELKAGEKILIQGGAGGVGSYAVQLAKYRKAFVIVTASPNNHEYMKK